ncbi:MAG: hypothetical protein CMN30_12235 [Sandaracinus sp.]|nr:hypothetical protein [Sandaracinus sp.]
MSEGIDAETIEGYLAAGGWKMKRIAAQTWRGRFRTQRTGRKFPVLVHQDVNEGFLTAAIVPLVRSPEDAGRAHALYTRLLELNQVFFMAKLSIDDDLDVVLSVEYPLADLDESELVDALQALAYYADVHHDEIQRIAEGR